ncbi:hypothetical protein AVEN_108853-1 [Araneus ventricosus]|uniref:Uncharacterized protein n=1 Tax=Araneus ventricosus TaxID=182803 RepID=A0A4Y2WTG9_ARAVE|nr:hypothetical protein AVEN_108853-1 [Araneus ventricosus]
MTTLSYVGLKCEINVLTFCIAVTFYSKACGIISSVDPFRFVGVVPQIMRGGDPVVKFKYLLLGSFHQGEVPKPAQIPKLAGLCSEGLREEPKENSVVAVEQILLSWKRLERRI